MKVQHSVKSVGTRKLKTSDALEGNILRGEILCRRESGTHVSSHTLNLQQNMFVGHHNGSIPDQQTSIEFHGISENIDKMGLCLLIKKVSYF